MYEYEVEVTVSDKNNIEHIIKRYIVCSIMGRYQLKDHIEDMLKKDIEISQYTLINYGVINWNET